MHEATSINLTKSYAYKRLAQPKYMTSRALATAVRASSASWYWTLHDSQPNSWLCCHRAASYTHVPIAGDIDDALGILPSVVCGSCKLFLFLLIDQAINDAESCAALGIWLASFPQLSHVRMVTIPCLADFNVDLVVTNH